MRSVEGGARPAQILRRAVQGVLPVSWYTRLSDLVRARRFPLVSVVVPVYQVEAYVEECLASILAQTYRHIEVIVVDDGSTDRSMEVVRRLASADSRVRIVRQRNSGLGAARNTGVRHARGSLLCFVDSDDTIPRKAIEVMQASLSQSGSDFAVGAPLRRTSTGTHMTEWVKSLHRVTRRGITIDDEPDAVKNVFAWTKMFRMEFFRRAVEGFPDGIYEDQVPSAKAFLYGRFDLLRDVVCHWRIRDDSSSITQQKRSMSDLTARWSVIGQVAEVMRDASPKVRRRWEAKVVGFDMRPYYTQVLSATDEYWVFLRRQVRAFLDSVGFERLADVAVADRLAAAAVYHGFRDDVVELVSRWATVTRHVPGVVNGTRAWVADEYFDGLSLERDGLVDALQTVDHAIVSHVDRVRINECTVAIRGSAYLADLGPASDAMISVVAVSKDGTQVPGSIRRFVDPEIDLRAADPWNDHAGAEFEATFEVATLPASRWTFTVNVAVGALSVAGPLPSPDPRGAGRPPVLGPLAEPYAGGPTSRWVVDGAGGRDDLVLRRTSFCAVPVERVTVHGDDVEIYPATGPENLKEYVATSGRHVRHGHGRLVDGRPVVTFSLPPPESGVRRVWALERRGANGGRLCFRGMLGEVVRDEHERGRLQVETTRSGHIEVATAPIIGEIVDLELERGGLRVRGWVCSAPALETERLDIGLTTDGLPGASAELAPGPGGDFDAVIPLVDALGRPIAQDVSFVVTVRAGNTEARLRASTVLVRRLRLELSASGLGATVSATPKAGAVGVRFHADLGVEERSRRGQERLRREYRDTRAATRADTVLLESFGGSIVDGSPLALSQAWHDRGDRRTQYWSIVSACAEVPDWAIPVLRGSRRWYELLATASVVVTNGELPGYFVQRDGQAVVHLDDLGRAPGPADLVLVSTLPGGDRDDVRYLSLEGAVPWADVLFRASKERIDIRERLGLANSDRAYLYVTDDGRPTDELTVRALREAVRATSPDEGAVLLVEDIGAPRAADAVEPTGPRVLRTAGGERLSDLLVASDALILPGSLRMPTYGMLGRPFGRIVVDRVVGASYIEWSHHAPTTDPFVQEFPDAARHALDVLEAASGGQSLRGETW